MSDLKPLVFSLQDSLMLLAPRGWKSVELSVVQSGSTVKLTELTTRGEGATEPRPRAPVQVDLREEATRLSDGLTELHGSLAGRWTPGVVHVDRTDATCDWKLLNADGKVAWFTRLSKNELGSLLVTDALLDAVTGTSRAFDVLQTQLTDRLGTVTSFVFDTGRCLLTLERPSGRLDLPAQLVGAYLPTDWAWVWGWGDPEATPEAVDQVRRVCAPDAQPDGLSAFWRPNFHCDERFAWTLAGNVVVSIGARGLFRGGLPDGSGAVFFALMALP